MQLPFTPDQFFDVFVRYNERVWPAQIILVLLALAAVAAAIRATAGSAKVAAGILAMFWLWMGLVYHALFFRRINPAAAGFAVAFVVQGALLLWYGLRSRRLRLRGPVGIRGAAGAALMGYALLVYPLIGWLTGHGYPAQPTFGLPCPTTIFTLGLLMWAERPVPWAVTLIPIGWGVVGTFAALGLGVPEDLGLAVAAAAMLAVQIAERAGRRPARRVITPAGPLSSG